MPVAESVLRFVEDELGCAPALAARVHADTLQALQGAARAPSNAGQRAHQRAAFELLAPRAAGFADAFCAALRRRVSGELADSRGADEAAATPVRAIGTLELVDESRVEVDIEISRAAQAIDSGAEWELRELQTYTSALAGLRHVRADSLPLRPHVYAAALWDAACALTTEPALRLVLLRMASPALAAELRLAWAQASARLDAQGLTPSAYRSVRLPPGRGPDALRRPPAPPPASSPFQALLAEVVALAPMATPSAAAGAAATTAVGEGGVPSAQGAQRASLVARLFRAFAADDSLGEDLHAVIAALQPPLLRLVRVDDGMLHGLQHPAWALVDRIARVGDEHPAGDPRRQSLLAVCTPLVAGLGALDLPDAAALRRVVAALDAAADALWQQRLQQAQGALDQLARLERRDSVQLEAAARMGERLATQVLPAVLRRFLVGPWARVIAQAEVDHGLGDPAVQQAWRTVDDLLWSLDVPSDAAGRRRLAARLPALLAALRAGMGAIGLAEPERQAVFDALLAVHTDQPGAAAAGAHGTAAAAAPHQPAPAGGFADSLIDLGSLDTVPAELLPGTTDPPDAPPAALAVGQSAQIFIDGRWARVQLLWRSARGLYLLLAEEPAGRTRSMTRRAFDQLQAARLVRPAVAGSLVQRTLRRLSTQLSLQ